MDKEQCMLDARILQAQGYTQMQIAQMLGVTDSDLPPKNWTLMLRPLIKTKNS